MSEVRLDGPCMCVHVIYVRVRIGGGGANGFAARCLADYQLNC